MFFSLKLQYKTWLDTEEEVYAVKQNLIYAAKGSRNKEGIALGDPSQAPLSGFPSPCLQPLCSTSILACLRL